MAGAPSRPHIPVMVLAMTDEDVVQRAAKLFGGVTVQVCTPQQRHHKVPFVARLTGRKAVQLMRKLYPLMGERRQRQMLRAIYSFEDKRDASQTKKMADAVVEQIARWRRAGFSWREVKKLSAGRFSHVGAWRAYKRKYGDAAI